jgi:NAD-dependent SIR2 family protein deacetylase
MSDYNEILKEIARKDNLVAFVGAGVPASTRIPTWKGLLIKLKQNYDTNFNAREADGWDEYEYPEIAQEIYVKYLNKYKNKDDEKGKKEYLKAIKKVLKPKDWSHTACQLQILNTFEHVITTNFDPTFTNAKKAYQRLHESNNKIHEQSLPNIIIPKIYENKNIIYLHGRVDSDNRKSLPSNIIFKKDDYEIYYEPNNPNYCNKLFDMYKHLFQSFTLVFIGVSFDDIYIDKMLHIICEDIKRDDKGSKIFSQCNYNPIYEKIQHYAFMEDPEVQYKNNMDNLNRKFEEKKIGSNKYKEQKTEIDNKRKKREELFRKLERHKIKIVKYKRHLCYEDWLNQIYDIRSANQTSKTANVRIKDDFLLRTS